MTRAGEVLIEGDATGSRMSCGFCGDRLPEPLKDVSAVGTPTGIVIASMERPVHRCSSISKSDEMYALRRIGADRG